MSAGDGLFRHVTRLVAHSGLQFLDADLPRSVIEGVGRRLIETRVDLGDTSIWALGDPNETTAIDAPSLQMDGRSVVRAALDRWLPLPLLRYIGRDGTGRPRFDAGPNNWARVHLSLEPRPSGPADGRDGAVKVVVAIDTDIDPQSRLDLDAYTTPTGDDVQFGSSFATSDDPVAIAEFLAEAWVQSWLADVFVAITPTDRRGAAPRAAGLVPIAAYLTLLSVLQRAAVLPSVQFFDARPDVAPPVPVDLVLDVGTCRTAGLLIEGAGPDGRDITARTRLLSLRDLTEPARRYAGAVESRITFSRPTFGNEALSRRSGRRDAFRWPSLTRVGPEAARLVQTARPEDGAVTVATPRAHITDTTERDAVWRFAMDPRRRLPHAPMVAGPMLAHVPAVAGLLPSPDGAPYRPLALRPRFSLSATMSFLIAEVLLQALATINAPAATQSVDNPSEAATGEISGPRALRHVILTLPLAMPLAQRQLMRERAVAAIDMLWSAQGWDVAENAFAPLRPTVRLGLDETLSAQLVYLYDEIGHRFAGDARDYLEAIGRSRPEFGVQPCLRMAALDVGGGHAHVTIVTYAQQAGTPIAPTLFGVQRSRIGTEAVLGHVVDELIWPSLRAALAHLGHPDPACFLGMSTDPLTHRLEDQWLQPAARSLVATTIGMVPGGQQTELCVRLGDLVEAANAETAAAVAGKAASEGAPGLVLAQVPINLRLSTLNATVEAALAPMVAGLMPAIVAADCDVILLSGWAARLPALAALIRRHRAWRPDRLVVATDRDWHTWYPLSEADRHAADGKDLALVGALLGLGGGDNFGFAAFGEGAMAADLAAGGPGVWTEPAP